MSKWFLLFVLGLNAIVFIVTLLQRNYVAALWVLAASYWFCKCVFEEARNAVLMGKFIQVSLDAECLQRAVDRVHGLDEVNNG